MLHLNPFLKQFIKSSFFIVLVLFMFDCNNSDKSNVKYEQTKKVLANKERSDPMAFLKVLSTDKKNLIGQTVVKAKLKNTATICSYKNVRIKMLTYKKGKMVEEHEDVLEEVIRPGSSVNFKLRYRLPKGTDSVALSVMNAEIAE
jgi:hypothetical protein